MIINRTCFFLQKNRKVIILSLLLMLLIACGFFIFQGKWGFPFSKPGTSPSNSQTPSTDPIDNKLPAWLTVYFTNPNLRDTIGSGIDQYVQKAIDEAEKSIDVTSFDLNLPNLVNALINASKRGVEVRVVYDGTNGSLDINNIASAYKPFDTVKTLSSANIPLVNGGRSNGLMHNKMVIVDSKILFMGSWNLSYNDTYRNNNNLLRITDPQIIENYQVKFNEMFVNKRFGNKTQAKTPNLSMNIEGIKVENWMAPKDNVMARLVKIIQGAKKTIHFLAYTFTADDLANAMIARSKAGVRVEGVIEDRNAYQGSLMDLVDAKVQVFTDGNKYNMHHKVIIIDGEIIITGSYNFTMAANTINDDNILVIYNQNTAALFEHEYQQIRSLSEKPLP